MSYTDLQIISLYKSFNIQLAFVLLITDMEAIYFRHSEILWQRSQSQQIRLFIVFVYTEANQQVHCFAYMKCFSRNTFHPNVQFQA